MSRGAGSRGMGGEGDGRGGGWEGKGSMCFRSGQLLTLVFTGQGNFYPCGAISFCYTAYYCFPVDHVKPFILFEQYKTYICRFFLKLTSFLLEKYTFYSNNLFCIHQSIAWWAASYSNFAVWIPLISWGWLTFYPNRKCYLLYKQLNLFLVLRRVRLIRNFY